VHPYLLQIGEFTIASYPFLYGLGVGLAGLVLSLLLRARGVSLARAANVFLLAAAAVVVGGQTLYAIVRWEHVRHDVDSFISLSSGGQILYGSILLATPVLWLTSRLMQLSWRDVLDATAVCAPLGLVFGRLGCFCKGCCHGAVTDVSWAVSYPKVIDPGGAVIGTEAFLKHVNEGLMPAAAAGSLPVHPSQLYESGAMLIVFGLMLMLWARGGFTGRLAFVFILCYAAERFCVEFVRVQETVLAGLTLAQVMSILLGGASLTAIILPTRAQDRGAQDLFVL
jgi:phosphatidylglycerol:prolipoprotein diacylglycerol transferase